MLTVLLATARAPKCFTFFPDRDQFEFLGEQLAKQTFRNFELVVVTPFPGAALEKLSPSVERLTVVEPRDTPWRRAKMFAVCSARNTGLVHAKGEWVLTIDDCTEIEPDFLERIDRWSQQGIGVSVMYRNASGAINDTRWPIFETLAKGLPSTVIRKTQGPTPQGFICFPLEAAVRVNGYDEIRFDGARGLEDMNFARRLMMHGVAFAMDRDITAKLHEHIGYPEEVIANEDQNARCCNTAHALSDPSKRANLRRYTSEEKRQVLDCVFWRPGAKCSFNHALCAYPSWGEHGHHVARDVLENDREELFNLAEARKIR